MKVIEIARPGGPEVLTLADRPRPEPGPGQVLIEVAAAGVNRPDIMQRQGHYAPPPGVTDVPGLEVSGTVVALGTGAERWQVGDKVMALVAGGGYAELCVAPEPQCLPLPTGVSMIEAAAMPETFFTVWTNVFERGRLSRGEVLLAHGGSGGIGTTAIQLGRAFGARVFATAGSAEKRSRCEKLGAKRAMDPEREDWVAELRAATAGRGADVILDMLGAEALQMNLDALAPEGRLVFIAFLDGARAQLNLRPILEKRLTVTGSTLRPRSVEEKGAIARALETSVWPLVAEGRVAPVVHATFPLERAADAHRLMEGRAHFGKLVLTVGAAPSQAARLGAVAPSD